MSTIWSLETCYFNEYDLRISGNTIHCNYGVLFKSSLCSLHSFNEEIKPLHETNISMLTELTEINEKNNNGLKKELSQGIAQKEEYRNIFSLFKLSFGSN